MTVANYVSAGDYSGRMLELKSGGRVFIRDKRNRIPIDRDTVEAYEVIDETTKTSGTSAVARGALGAALLGPVGAAAALSAKKKSTYKVAIDFRDGARSLLMVDENVYNLLLRMIK